jgi:hypothetical protein
MRLFQSIIALGIALAPVSGAAEATAVPANPASAPAAGAPDSSKATTPVPAVSPQSPASAAAAPSPAPSSVPGLEPAADLAAGPVRAADTVAIPPPANGKLTLGNAVLQSLALSGTVQVKAFYRDFASDPDSAKRLSLQLRRFKLGLEGAVSAHAGFRGEFLLDGANKAFGAEDAYLWWRLNDMVGFKGGKLKRPFSQEALQSSRSLYTVERGELYHDFLAETTGYAYYDLGLIAYGGFTEDDAIFGYEFGVFNGKQSGNGYANQQAEKTDAGFIAKDVVARLSAAPIRGLKLEAAVSTKAAEDRSDPSTFAYAVNTAYELGLEYVLGPFRLLGEASMGDNHKGKDSLIVDGSARFFAFYAMGVWHEGYSGGRASELVLKLEGLDPDFGWKKGHGRPNDGLLRYTGGCNYFFTPAVSLLADYSLLQPITKVPHEDRLIHSLDVLWRVSF